jgi:hypothetical protein
MKTEERLDFPFELPKEFLTRLGYEGYQVPEEFRRMAREQWGAEIPPFEPRRFVGVWWEPCGDEASWDDGFRSLCGADYTVLLEILHHRAISTWMIVKGVHLGSSEEPPYHWLIVDRETGRAFVAPVAIARAIVQSQTLEVAA